MRLIPHVSMPFAHGVVILRLQVLHARGKSLVVELVPESSAASVWVVYTGADIGLGAVFEQQAA